MQCPNCSTKVQEHHQSCPHCGRRLPVKRKAEAKTKSKLSPSSVRSSSASGTLSPSSKATKVAVKEPEIELSVPVAPEPVEVEDSAPVAPEPETDGSAPPSAARIRTLVVEDPEQIEAGLAVYTDKKGKQVGVEYPTPVGSIDLLARDAQGSLVVVLVANPGDEAELAAAVLQRMGWAQKHLNPGKKTVRGLILVETVPDSLLYAASALPDSVGIRTYRMALCFDVVEA